MREKKKLMPWLNQDGSRKQDSEISHLGRRWDTKTWSDYLDSELGAVENEGPLRFFGDMDTGAVYERKAVLDVIQNSESNQALESALLIAMLDLSTLECEVLKYSYWWFLSDKEISKASKSTYRSVRVSKSNALRKLGLILSSKKFKRKMTLLKKSNSLAEILRSQREWLGTNP